VITTDATPFEVGRAQTFRERQRRRDRRVRHLGLQRADRRRGLAREDGIECRVVNNHTVKPMDDEAIVEAARACGAVVTVEEHQVHGGMGSRVAEILATHASVPIEFIGVQDRFGQSGDPVELVEHYGMGTAAIKEAVRTAYARKRG
jgi:transketolase